MPRLFLISLISVLFVLALCLRSLADASPLSGAMFLGHALWTYKAAIPVACFCASLVMVLWGMGAAVLRQWQLCSACMICALPMLFCCAFVCPAATLPFIHEGCLSHHLQQFAPELTLFTLTNFLGAWGLANFWQSRQGKVMPGWKAGLSLALLAEGFILNIHLWTKSLSPYNPAWELGLACWVSYSLFMLVLVLLLVFYLASKSKKCKKKQLSCS